MMLALTRAGDPLLPSVQAPKAEKELYYKDWGTAFTGETVPSSSLPKITRSDFDDYLSAVPPVRERCRRDAYRNDVLFTGEMWLVCIAPLFLRCHMPWG
jgi:hypothetical protein